MHGDVVIDGLVEYTQGELERIAADFLKQRPDVQLRVPVNIEVLLERMPNVDLDVVHSLRANHNVEGCVCTTYLTRDRHVLIDKDIAHGFPAKYNAVLGEELAHLLLHEVIIDQIEDTADFLTFRRHPKWLRIERDANYLSRALRMPRDVVVDRVVDLYAETIDDQGFDRRDSILNRIIVGLSQQLVVPMDDARVRIVRFPGNEIEDRIDRSLASRSDSLLSPSQSLYYPGREPKSLF